MLIAYQGLHADYLRSKDYKRNQTIGFFGGLGVTLVAWAIATFLMPFVLGTIILLIVALAAGLYQRKVTHYFGYKIFAAKPENQPELPAPLDNSDLNELLDEAGKGKSYSVSFGPKENMERDLKDL